MRLERQAVVATALRLLNQVGLDGLTLRRLAKELDVQAPALYWHFANKQELLDQMADALFAQGAQLRPPADGQPWDAWLAEGARRQRAAVLAYRDGARLAAATGRGAATLSVIDQAVGALRRAGFTPAQALRSMLAVHNYTVGFVLEEQADRERRTTPELQHQEAVAVLGGGGYPDLAKAIAEGGDPQGEETFEFGLKLLIQGLRAALAEAGHQP